MISGGVLIPIAEEWLFRGLLQQSLTRAWGAWAGIVVPAAVFGLLHGLGYAIYAGLVGLILGAASYFSRSLTRAILIHMLINLTNFTLLIFVERLAG